MDIFINIYGYPQPIHSDQGICFECTLIKQWCDLSSIGTFSITPYHPAENRGSERFNWILLGLLRTLAVDKKS